MLQQEHSAEALYILGGKQRQNNGVRDESLCHCPREHQARSHSGLAKPAEDQRGGGYRPASAPQLHGEAFEQSPERVCPMKMESALKEA